MIGVSTSQVLQEPWWQLHPEVLPLFMSIANSLGYWAKLFGGIFCLSLVFSVSLKGGQFTLQSFSLVLQLRKRNESSFLSAVWVTFFCVWKTDFIWILTLENSYIRCGILIKWTVGINTDRPFLIYSHVRKINLKEKEMAVNGLVNFF